MITGLILAAGQGKRLGAVKPLLPTDRGMMLDIVLQQYRARHSMISFSSIEMRVV